MVLSNTPFKPEIQVDSITILEFEKAAIDNYNKKNWAEVYKNLLLIEQILDTGNHIWVDQPPGYLDEIQIGFYNISRLYYWNKWYRNALAFVDCSIDYRINFYRHHIGILNDRTLIHAYRLKGLVLMKLFEENGDTIHANNAIRCFKLSIEQVEIDRDTLGQMNYFNLYPVLKNQKMISQEAMQYCALAFQKTREEHYLDEALYFSEKSKQGLLFNSLATRMEIRDSHQYKKLREVKLLHAAIIDSINNLDKNSMHYSSQVNLFELRLQALSEEEDKLIKEIDLIYLKPSDKRTDQVLAIYNIQTELEENQMLIEYSLSPHLTDTSRFILYTFILNKDDKSLRCDTLDKVLFNSGLWNVINYISKKKGDYNEFIDALNYLSGFLSLPLKEMLTDKRLIIIPDGILCYLPFDVLLTEKAVYSEKPVFDRLHYLIRENPIATFYQASLIPLLRNNIEKGERKLVGFAPDSVEIQLIPADQDVNLLKPPPKIPRLDGAIEEVTQVARIFHGEAFLGERATEKRFREIAGKYDIILLSMHSMLMEDHPMESQLIFTQSADTNTDDCLRVYELMNLDLDANLVVLSSCFSGSGEYIDGEGIISLAWGFFNAGVKSVVMSLWSVPDRAGRDVIIEFFKDVKKGKPLDIALQAAKLQYLENSSGPAHPYYWAGYQCSGNITPLFEKKISLYWSVTLLPVLIFIGLLMIIIKRRKHYRSGI